VRAGVTFFVKQFAPPPEAGGKRARGCVVVVRLSGGGMGHHPGVAAAPRGLCILICRRCEDSRDGRWDVGHRGGQRAPVLNPFFFFFYELKTPRTRPPAAAAADASVMRSPPRRRQCRHRRPPAGLSLGGTARPGERRRSSRGAPGAAEAAVPGEKTLSRISVMPHSSSASEGSSMGSDMSEGGDSRSSPSSSAMHERVNWYLGG